MMNERVTNAVTRCLEIDVDFYRELLVFLMKKHAKIMTDDLEWLTESLNKEQAYLMKSKSLEEKREDVFRGLGLQGRKLTELAEEAPEGYKAKMNLLINQLTELLENIKEINAETNDIVKRKLDNQREFVKQAGILEKPETYDKSAAKVYGGVSSAQVIRQI